MASIPRPPQSAGIGKTMGIVRNFDGQRGINEFTPGEQAADMEWRRNAKDSFDESDIANY